MGDIADMMIDGEMCEQCGEYLGGGSGFARLCRGCDTKAYGEGENARRKTTKKKRRKQFAYNPMEGLKF